MPNLLQLKSKINPEIRLFKGNHNFAETNVTLLLISSAGHVPELWLKNYIRILLQLKFLLCIIILADVFLSDLLGRASLNIWLHCCVILNICSFSLEVIFISGKEYDIIRLCCSQGNKSSHPLPCSGRADSSREQGDAGVQVILLAGAGLCRVSELHRGWSLLELEVNSWSGKLLCFRKQPKKEGKSNWQKLIHYLKESRAPDRLFTLVVTLVAPACNLASPVKNETTPYGTAIIHILYLFLVSLQRSFVI